MTDPSFATLGTLEYMGGSSANSLSSTITNVSVGDLLIVFVQRAYQTRCTGVASVTPALTFTKLETAVSGDSDFNPELWGAIATQAAASMTITASYSDEQPWGSVFSVRYSPGGVTSITPQANQGHDAKQTSSTNRTITNIVTSTRTLMIAAGADWNYYCTHTAAANWTKRVDSQTFGEDSTTQFFYDRIANAGTYPSGNYGSADPTDVYLALIVALEIEEASAVIRPLPTNVAA